jgi:hypothetical protein
LLEEVMKINVRGIRYAILGAFLAACGASGVALADDEVEPNYNAALADPMSVAQPLNFVETYDAATSTVTAVATVSAFMGSGDADVFSFPAKEGDVVTVDIDDGAKIGAGSIDSIVSLHHPAQPTLPGVTPYKVMTWNDDGPPDPGSVGSGDSYIKDFVIPAQAGTYYVAVTGYDNHVFDGGVFNGAPVNATGSYTLIVTIVKQAAQPPAPEPTPEPAPAPEPTPQPQPQPQALTIGIDIKPGLRVISRINPKARGEIPVALLSSSTFDATTVKVDTLTFGHMGDEQSLKRCLKRGVDVNHDRRPDLLCFFENQKAGFEPSDEQGVLRGEAADGTPFEGSGVLKVVPEKRYWQHSHRHDRDDDRDDRGRRHR